MAQARPYQKKKCRKREAWVTDLRFAIRQIALQCCARRRSLNMMHKMIAYTSHSSADSMCCFFYSMRHVMQVQIDECVQYRKLWFTCAVLSLVNTRVSSSRLVSICVSSLRFSATLIANQMEIRRGNGNSYTGFL